MLQHIEQKGRCFITEKRKIAICMKEGEYLTRLSGCLMNHYRNALEIHIFTSMEQMEAVRLEEYHGIMLGDYPFSLIQTKKIPEDKILYLTEEEITEEGSFRTISKYEEIPKMVDMLEILSGNKEYNLNRSGCNGEQKHLYGVYSLHNTSQQLPFIIAFANILAENKKVLVIDLQENSGLGAGVELSSGMEDVMAMAKSGKYSRGRLISAIGHYQQWDYIYPVRNSECLCEGDYDLYKSVLQMMEKEMGYEAVIINFGVRFMGFFQFVSDCKACILLGNEEKKNWREQAFYEEAEKRGQKELENKFIKIHMPEGHVEEFSPQRLAEKWMWNEPGELLREIIYREKYSG